ncbi:MAG: hypothetical protein ABL927_06135 [Bdellovibrionales bacterium]
MTTPPAHDNKKPVISWQNFINKLKVYVFLALALTFAGFSYSDVILRKFFQPRTGQLIPIGRITKVSWSSDRLTAVDTLWLPLIQNDPIFVGDMIKTRKYSQLELHLENGTDISLESDTLIQIKTHRGKLVFSFYKGDAQFKNAKDIVVKKGLTESPAQNQPQPELPKNDENESNAKPVEESQNQPSEKSSEAESKEDPVPAKTFEKAAPEFDTTIYPQDHSILVLSKSVRIQMKVNAQIKKEQAHSKSQYSQNSVAESSDLCTTDCELIVESDGKQILSQKMTKGQVVTALEISPNQIYKWKLFQKVLVGGDKIIREGDFETVAPTSLQLKKAIDANRTVEFVN